VVTNNNNYSIYNISLDNIVISGFVIGGLENNVAVSELAPGTSVSFGSLIFGIGSVTVTAQISYDDQGKHFTREITGNFFFLGPLVFPMFP